MELTRATLDSVYTGYKTVLSKGFSQVNKDFEAFTTFIKSTDQIERYPFTNLSATMEKWIGPRKIGRVDGKMLEVVNESYQTAQAVPRTSIFFNKFNVYDPIFTDMGINAGNLWGRLAAFALATNPIWADGKTFFNAAHKFGKSTINNLSSSALSLASYNTAYAAMMGYCDAAGDGIGIVPDILLVGPSNREIAQEIAAADIVAKTVGESVVPVSNTNKGSAKVIIDPRLVGTHASKWFLLCTSRGIKPVVVQKAKEGILTRRDSENDDCVFNRDENEYGIHSIGAASPTIPHIAYGGGFA